MGVPGLWEIINPAGRSRSLTSLAVVDGFEANDSGRRAYRIGVDASIWYQHAMRNKDNGGDNPVLLNLFWKVRALADLPFLPLFVFDGRNRPDIKRGSKKGKAGSHNQTRTMKELLDAFGMEWREAEGEAEAELAYLNSKGLIDAVLTDDVDAFVFGATTVIRNASLNLSGNKANPAVNMEGNPSQHHVNIYHAKDIEHQCQMTQGGMILFALLVGGDYDKGVDKFGEVTACALARCGFGDSLFNAFKKKNEQSLHVFLPRWRAEVNKELQTNSRRKLQHAMPRLSLPPDFPNLKFLEYYAAPRTGATAGRHGSRPTDVGEMDLAKIAGFCEKYSEWGTKSMLIKKFRNFMWRPAVMHILRRAALEQDKRERDKRVAAGGKDGPVKGVATPSLEDAVGLDVSFVKKYLKSVNRRRVDDDWMAAAFVNRAPPPPSRTMEVRASGSTERKPLIEKILKRRFPRRVSTDYLLEIDLEMDPKPFVELALSGMKGSRPDVTNAVVRDEEPALEEDDDQDEGPGGKEMKGKGKQKEKDVDPLKIFKMTCPASMLLYVNPQLFDSYFGEIEDKKRKEKEKEESKEERERKKREKDLQKESRERRKQEKEDEAAKGVTGAAKGKGKRKMPAALEQESELSSDEWDGSTAQSPLPKKRKTRQDKAHEPPREQHKSSSQNFVTRCESHHVPLHTEISSRRTTSIDKLPQYSELPSIPSSQQAGPSRRTDSRSELHEDWTQSDGPSPQKRFKFTLPESDNPDHLERDDLNERYRQDLTASSQWSDPLSERRIVDPMSWDDEDDLTSRDEMLDRQFEASFMKSAKAININATGHAKLNCPAGKKTGNPSGGAGVRPQKRSGRLSLVEVIPSVKETSRTGIPTAARRQSSPLFTRTNAPLLRSSPTPPPRSSQQSSMIGAPQSSPLFLPSPPHAIRELEQHSSTTSSQLTLQSDVVDLDDSDDEAIMNGPLACGRVRPALSQRNYSASSSRNKSERSEGAATTIKSNSDIFVIDDDDDVIDLD